MNIKDLTTEERQKISRLLLANFTTAKELNSLIPAKDNIFSKYHQQLDKIYCENNQLTLF